MRFICFLASVFTIFSLFGSSINLHRNQFEIGPVFYKVDRKKTSGCSRGTLNGVRAQYERFKRYGWYLGVEGWYAQGSLHGKNIAKDKLHSKMTDQFIEGRLGYSFQQKEGFQIALTPFFCGGYFIEKNSFSSPFSVDFKTKFPYVGGGVQIWAQWKNWVELGLFFRARYPLDPKCSFQDAEEGKISQTIKERVQYFVEIPLMFRLSCDGKATIGFSPFYESRLYGGHPNYPTYYKTKYSNWGINLKFEYRI